jgi:hypothetical protein
VGRSEVERRRSRREFNFKIDLQEVGLEGMDWIDQFNDWDRWRAAVNKQVNRLVS